MRMFAVAAIGSLVVGLSACSTAADVAPQGHVLGVAHVSAMPTGTTASASSPAGRIIKVKSHEKKPTTITVFADSTGHFSMGLPPGGYTLMCEPAVEFTVKDNETVNLDCGLSAV